ncbi:lymphocyte function-associated antigen 3 isoform 3-T3 [Macrochelys suwanniensis]
MGLACRLSALGLLLLSALLVCIRSQDPESVFAIEGEHFTFSPKVNGTIREITWMKRKNKVAEWELDGSPTYFSSLAERGVLDTSSGSLTIKNLRIGDAAEYEAQVLPVHDVQLQSTKFVLEVLAPPPPSVLNCSVINDQIRISCAIHFSKDVRYSWYQGGRKIIGANSPVLQLKENADPTEKVLCIREVSKTKINETISLSSCFPSSPKSLSRTRDGLVAIFVVVILLLFVGALFVLWKKGLLSNICCQIPTKHSAVYTPGKQNHTEDDGYPEKSGQKEDPEYENELAAHQSDPETAVLHSGNNNVAEAESGEEKNSKETKSTSQSQLFCNQENPDYENTSKGNQEPGREESMNRPDLVSSHEKTALQP